MGRLRLRAIEDEGCALRASLPDYDAVLDIGQWRSAIYPVRSIESFTIASGGEAITAAIERDLNLDRSQAEKRKRILGTAGAGEKTRGDFITSLASLVEAARNTGPCQRVAVVGNGARLSGILAELTTATGCVCDFAVSHALDGETYSRATIAAAAPDWTLAASLAR